MAKVTIRIPRDPKAPRSVEVEGVMGTSCKDLTAGIQNALGNTKSDVETEEYHKTEQTQEETLTQGQ